ncbi:MAG: hypothetical protein HYX69_22970 [Planctomycetia bacterium]|nr:hypothetical protein [Planctomycetia bacterium]
MALDRVAEPQQLAIDPQILQYVLAAAAGAVFAVTAWRSARYVARWLFRRGKSTPELPAADASLDQLAPTGPPSKGPKLTAYNVPVRLVILVLAPVGRGRAQPAIDRLPGIIDQIVPDLHAVVVAHGTRIKLWPPQLSTHGFAAALFANIPLPENRGRGTPWCSIAGRFLADGQPWLAGMILRAAGPNNLSQATLEHEPQWLEILRCTS